MESETSASPAERYEKRIAYFSEQAKTFDARSRRYSNLRLAIVLLGAASVIVTPKDNAFGVGVLAGFLVLLVILFAIVAFRHQSVEEALSHARAMTNLNAEGQRCVLGSLHSGSAFVGQGLARLFCVLSPFLLVFLFALNLIGYLPKWPWSRRFAPSLRYYMIMRAGHFRTLSPPTRFSVKR
jgi:hypothetical protein